MAPRTLRRLHKAAAVEAWESEHGQGAPSGRSPPDGLQQGQGRHSSPPSKGNSNTAAGASSGAGGTSGGIGLLREARSFLWKQWHLGLSVLSAWGSDPSVPSVRPIGPSLEGWGTFKGVLGFLESRWGWKKGLA